MGDYCQSWTATRHYFIGNFSDRSPRHNMQGTSLINACCCCAARYIATALVLLSIFKQNQINPKSTSRITQQRPPKMSDTICKEKQEAE